MARTNEQLYFVPTGDTADLDADTAFELYLLQLRKGRRADVLRRLTELLDNALDEVIVVPVLRDPMSAEKHGTRGQEPGAHIVWGDVTDSMYLTPFEATLAEYEGTDLRSNPVIDFDEVSADRFQAVWQ